MALLRTRRCLPLISAALIAASCSAPTDIVVTASQESERTSGPLAKIDPIDPIDQPIDPGSAASPAESFGPAQLVLAESDLPGWRHSGPRRVDAEETFVAVDCPLMNTVWRVAGTGGVRSRGTIDGASFRNTAVRMPSSAAAAAVLDAAGIVWMKCPEFAGTVNTWSIEPLDMPAGASRSAGLLLSTQGVDGWAIGLWQVDDVVVVLELEGSQMWLMIDHILEKQQARADAASQTLAPAPDPASAIDDVEPPVPSRPQSNDPPANNPPANNPPANNPPVTSPPVTSSVATDDSWMQHRLARLVPDPADLIGEWQLSSANVVEAAPADPANAIPGCETEIPPMLDGIDVTYRSRSDASEAQSLEFIVSTGSLTDTQVLVDAIRAVPSCDLAATEFQIDFVAADFGVVGADDSIVLIGTFVAAEPTSSVWIMVVARSGDVQVAAFLETVAVDADPASNARQLADLVAAVISRI